MWSKVLLYSEEKINENQKIPFRPWPGHLLINGASMKLVLLNITAVTIRDGPDKESLIGRTALLVREKKYVDQTYIAQANGKSHCFPAKWMSLLVQFTRDHVIQGY